MFRPILRQTSLVTAVMVSLIIHAALVFVWLSREVTAPSALAMQTVTVDLLALEPPAGQMAQPAPALPVSDAKPLPEPETLPEDAMAENPVVIKKPKPRVTKPAAPLPAPAPPPQKPDTQSNVASSASADTPAKAPSAPMPASAARYDADYLRNPPPVYPPLSRRLGEQGKVILKVRVSENGEAVAVEIQQGSGHARLDEAARKAAIRWRFVPARQGDVAVTSWVEVPIQFSLDN